MRASVRPASCTTYTGCPAASACAKAHSALLRQSRGSDSTQVLEDTKRTIAISQGLGSPRWRRAFLASSIISSISLHFRVIFAWPNASHCRSSGWPCAGQDRHNTARATHQPQSLVRREHREHRVRAIHTITQLGSKAAAQSKATAEPSPTARDSFAPQASARGRRRRGRTEPRSCRWTSRGPPGR